MYRLIYPARGWVRVLWPEGRKHSISVSLALSLVTQHPGCQLSEDGCTLDLPHTAWMLETVAQLLSEMGLNELAVPDRSDPEGDAWTPKREPYRFQWDAIEFALRRDGVLICDEMGLGKCTEAIVAAECFRAQKRRPGVIIAPLFTRDTWLDELTVMGAVNDPSEFCALQTRDVDSDVFRVTGVKWYFVHYDIAVSWWNQLTQLKPYHPVVAIVDEAHWVRNSRTQRSRGTEMILGHCERRILLTGTPLDANPSDLWFPLTLTTGPRTWGDPLSFRKRYCGATFNGHGYDDGDPTHIGELRKRMAPFYLRREIADVGIELPPLTRRVQYAELGKYAHEHDIILQHEDVEELVRAVAAGAVDHVLPILARLRQITSRAKLNATVELVTNALDQGTSVVVFAWEKEIARRLHDGIARARHTTFLVTGDDKQDDRGRYVSLFQQTECAALVATLDSLREGVTLHRARLVVHHDMTWVLSHLLQGEKRIHRIGQHHPCQSVWMVARNSIDTILAKILIRKAANMAGVLNIDAGQRAMEELELNTLVEPDAVDAQVERALELWGGAS